MAGVTDADFEAAARRYGDAVFRVALHAVGDRGTAEDVTQTVLLRLYRHGEEFQSADHLRHWLFRVAVNESRKVLRSPWRKRTVPLEDWDGPAPQREDSGVLEAVLALEPKYRLPIYLYYYEELSVKEAAEALGEKVSTVQTRLQRAREKLRLALEADERGNGYV